MRINKVHISINEILSQNRIFSVIIDTLFYLFFSTVRLLMKKSRPINENITIISLHRLGDTVFTIPALLEIQKHYQTKSLNIVCFPEAEHIYKLSLQNVNFCFLKREDFIWNGRLAGRHAKKLLRDLKPEIIIDLTGWSISASLIFDSNANLILGSNANRYKSVYDKFVPFRESPQLKDIYLDAISPLINLQERKLNEQPEVSVNPNGKILLHPFAGWKEKEWNLKKYITLAEKLRENYAVSFLVKGDELAIDVLEEIKKSRIEIIHSVSVEEMIQIIKQCSLFIGNDSGPVNIANFLGKPTFTIYGSTNPEFTSTGLAHQEFIIKNMVCSAGNNEKVCLVGGAVYNCSGTQCMNLLSVEAVNNKIASFINTFLN